MEVEWQAPLAGGILIGVAVSLMLLLNGRVTGISGIIYGLFRSSRSDLGWRVYFIAGMLSGGLLLQILKPSVFQSEALATDWTTLFAGLLVGFGTVLGSGCTSGHGVCGISRLSLRSIIASVTFIIFGIVTVMLFRRLEIYL